MLSNFKELPGHSRIWIYASEKKLSVKEQDFIIEKLSIFLSSWNSHKKELKAGINIIKSHFIIVGLNEEMNKASGCSIDSLNHEIHKIEKKLSMNLMNRLNIYCNFEEKIHCIPSVKLSEFANSETLFYDLTIQTKKDLTNFLKPISEGWCKNLI